jgi:hypothetical protein
MADMLQVMQFQRELSQQVLLVLQGRAAEPVVHLVMRVEQVALGLRAFQVG